MTPLSPELLSQILDRFNIPSLNPMQTAFAEAAEEYAELMLLSNTGSGKTLAYLLPLLNWLDTKNKGSQALIIAPSRELAQQIESVFKTMGVGMKVTCCYGGHKREIEENNLLEAPTLLIGTPGRLGDHIRRGSIDPTNIETLILDEFDKSLELGFQEEIAFVIGQLKNLKRKIFISATESVVIPDFLNVKSVHRLNFLDPEKLTEENKLTFQLLKSSDKDKLETLVKLVCYLGNRSTVVFCNHRESVERCSEYLKDHHIPNVFYHGAMEQNEREVALFKFKNGTSNLLVTTDLASRGLDIAHIRYIVHYHLPATEDVFTHRNGRTARMDASGTVILLIGPEEKIPVFYPELHEELNLPDDLQLPEKPKWATLFIAAGKKDKLGKIDIVGFLTQKGNLKKEDIGLIEVKDFISFAAVRKSAVSKTLESIKNEKIKNRKIKIDIAK